MRATTVRITKCDDAEKNGEDKTLKPCPFCGSPDVFWSHCMEREHVICDNCGASGPDVITSGIMQGAGEKAWNTRIAP